MSDYVLDSTVLFDVDTAADAGCYRFDQARNGVTISTPDAIQASPARRNTLILATSNPVDFP